MAARVCVLLMDSFGIGASLDAGKFGDKGANTLGHIIQACEQGLCDNQHRQGPLHIPNLAGLGLYHALVASCGEALVDLGKCPEPTGCFGYAVELSAGKDTPSGHWEIAGVPVLTPWGYFPDTNPCFPAELIDAFCEQTNVPGILGNCHASGVDIMQKHGQAHQQSGKPIIYTSADSVFQIAAHEDSFGLERLYQICQIARQLCDPYQIGRVIARPFAGEPGNYQRTANRRDYATPPPEATLLEKLTDANKQVLAIGKTADIFAHKGVSREIKGQDNQDLFNLTIDTLRSAEPGSLIFTNFVDFDSKYGHRRDIAGYAHALEIFDQKLPELFSQLQPDDKVLITADHGCDPSMPGSDHTREHVPVLAFGPTITPRFIGRRDTFADMGQTIATWLDIAPLAYGISFA